MRGEFRCEKDEYTVRPQKKYLLRFEFNKSILTLFLAGFDQRSSVQEKHKKDL